MVLSPAMQSRLTSCARALAASVLAVLLVAESAQANSGAEPGRWAAAAFDVVVVRPVSAVATVVGAALFVPAALITSPGGRPAISETWDVFVVTPANEAFKRRLGDF